MSQEKGLLTQRGIGQCTPFCAGHDSDRSGQARNSQLISLLHSWESPKPSPQSLDWLTSPSTQSRGR